MCIQKTRVNWLMLIIYIFYDFFLLRIWSYAFLIIVRAFVSAWKEACNGSTTSTVLVPEGTYLVSLAAFQGPCYAPTVFELRGVVNAQPGLALVNEENWIVFKYINNFTLTGGGVFHGRGSSAWPQNVCSQNSDRKLPIVSLTVSTYLHIHKKKKYLPACIIHAPQYKH